MTNVRALAVLVLANPHQAVRVLDAYHQQRSVSPPDPAKLLPNMMVHVHTYRGPEPSTGVVRVEGVGPVTETWVREFLGPRPGSGSSRSWTSRAKHRSTATRSPTDIDGPCI